MKQKLLLLAAVLVCTNIYSKGSNISFNEAWSILKRDVLSKNTPSCNVFGYEKVFPGNTHVRTIANNITSPAYDSWFFFVDDAPFLSWVHPCRYIFVNATDGSYQIENYKYPPLILENMTSLKEEVVTLYNAHHFPIKKKSTNTRNISNNENYHNYAVIINGGGSKYMNYERYWNHCSVLYSTLINQYNYPKENIFVLMSDGTNSADDRHLLTGGYDSSPIDLDGDGVTDVNYSATRNNISNVFNQLSTKLTKNDNLFVFVTDHGDQISGTNCALILWDEGLMTDTEFALEINKVNAAFINICLVQCYSGGFIDNLQASNRVITTSCSFDESADAMPPFYDFSEFTFHWLSAIIGETPYGVAVNADSNNDGMVSLLEAFVYARDNDTRAEHPQYSSTPTLLGTIEELSPMSIDGYTYVCDTSYYKIDNLCGSASVIWNWPRGETTGGPYPTLQSNYPSVNECIIKNPYKYPESNELSAKVVLGNDTLLTLTKDVVSVQRISSFSAHYTQQQCYYHGVTYPSISNVDIIHAPTTPHFVHQGCLVTLTSSWFKYKNIYYTGVTPEYWSYDGDQTITFSLPYASGGIPFRIHAGGNGCCDEANILFFSVSGIITNSQLNISRKGHFIYFHLTKDNLTAADWGVPDYSSGTIDTEGWDIIIYNATKCEKVLNEHVSSAYYYLDLNRLEKGIYVVTAKKKDEIISEKFSIYN